MNRSSFTGKTPELGASRIRPIIESYPKLLIDLQEVASAPDTPDSGYATLYVTTAGVLCIKNDAGGITPIGVVPTIRFHPGGGYRNGASTNILGSGYEYTHYAGFSDAATDWIGWWFRWPVGWSGSTVYLKWSWTTPTTNANYVAWGYEFRKRTEGDLLSATSKTTDVGTFTVPDAAYKVRNDSVNITNPASDGEEVDFRFYRDGSADTYNSAAYLLALELTIGS